MKHAQRNGGAGASPLSLSLLKFTVSLVMLAGAVSSVFDGSFTDRFGRLKFILADAVVMAVETALKEPVSHRSSTCWTVDN